MIVPRTRLLFWVAAVVLPFAALWAGAPPVQGTPPSAGNAWGLGVANVCAGAVVLLVAVAAVDAVLARKRLRGIEASLPDVVRLTKDREGTVPVKLVNATGLAKVLRVGLAFPREIDPAQDELDAKLPGDDAGRQFTLPWACTPRRRGQYPLQNVYLESASPLGLWAVRGTQPSEAEVRVYPNLAKERKGIEAIFLNRGGLGIHAQRQLGKGREFEKLREYVPGDSFDEIHWKATAKRGRPITKVFQVERTQQVYVVMDASRLSARTVEEQGDEGPVQVSQLERFIKAALVLGLAAERQGDQFGVMTFSDQVRQYVRAGAGKAHYSACRDAIYTLEPERVTPDFDELCTFIRLRLRRRSLLVLLTSLDDPVLSESFLRNVELIRRQHLVMVNMIAPRNIGPLFSGHEPETVGEVYDKLGGHLRWHDLRETERRLKHLGVAFNLVHNETLAAELVTQYVNVKQRQLL